MEKNEFWKYSNPFEKWLGEVRQEWLNKQVFDKLSKLENKTWETLEKAEITNFTENHSKDLDWFFKKAFLKQESQNT